LGYTALMKQIVIAVAVWILPAIAFCQEELKPVQDIVRKSRDSIVVVTTEDRNGEQAGLGTGFVIDKAGLIATNLHVIGEARPIWVETRDQRRYEVLEVHASDRTMDLAIIRIKPEEALTPLTLSTEGLAEGQLTVAIGHPLGLTNSVVSGIVSGQRKFGGNAMWQVAMTIEPGNSGGPLLDMQGRVHGVISMKGTGKQPFGFAVKATELKKLVENPNSISIEQWKTIGQINPARWEQRMGARWRQRSGRLMVEGAGDGFGGRALLLRKGNQDAVPFELAVTVKLDDEGGAAGLVFHSDGGDRHYGFYPSGGRLRLTSFEGPSVFSWNIIEDVDSEHYRRGEWNELKVQVAADKITCYCNGHPVIETDNIRHSRGAVGLCKFRETKATFRSFAVGKQVAARVVAGEKRDELVRQLANLGPRANLLDIDLQAQTTEVEQRIEILKSQARELQQRAEELQRVGRDLHVARVSTELATLVDKENDKDVDLLAGALWIAKLDNPELDVESYIDVVDDMAGEIQATAGLDRPPAERIQAMDGYLFERNGFHGSRTEYYDLANSQMDRVIDDREGLPVTLSVLYMSLAKRLGLNVVGVGLPGHFVVRHEPKSGEAQLIDVYDRGKRLSSNQANVLAFRMSGRPPRKSDFDKSSHTAILSRMLNNMLSLAEREQDGEAMLRYVEALVAVTPTPKTPSDWRTLGDLRGMRAVFRHREGRKRAALDDLDWILERKPPDMDLNQVRMMRELFSR